MKILKNALAMQQESKYISAITKLSSFSKMHKEKNSMINRKSAWNDEYQYLEKLEKHLNKSILLLTSSTPDLSAELDLRLQSPMSHLSDLELRFQKSLNQAREYLSCCSHENDAKKILLAQLLYDCQRSCTDLSTEFIKEEEAIGNEVAGLRVDIDSCHGSNDINNEKKAFMSHLYRSLKATSGNLNHLTDSAPYLLARDDIYFKLSNLLDDRNSKLQQMENDREFKLQELSTKLSKEDKFLFMKTVKAETALKLAKGNMSTFMDRLALEFPYIDRHTLCDLEQWYRHSSSLSTRKLQVEASCAIALKQLQKEALKDLQYALEAAEAQLMKNVEVVDVSLKRIELHRRLDVEKTKKASEESRLAALKNAELINMAKQQEIKKKQSEREQKQRHELIADYRREMMELMKEEAIGVEERIKDDNIARKIRMNHNGKRVEFRNDKAQLKRNLADQENAAAIERELRRQEIIQKIAADVPYREAILQAKSNLQHMTAAATSHAAQFEHVEKARGHHPIFGYDDKTLFRDKAFKLSFALGEAGLRHTTAARVAIHRKLDGVNIQNF